METKARKFKKNTSVPKSQKKAVRVAESKVIELKFSGRKTVGKIVRFFKDLKVDLDRKEGI